MTREHPHDLIAQGEGPALEFKRTLTKDLGRELCAFANSGGGTLLIGVSGRGRIIGVENHNRAKSRIRSIARSADPPINIDIDSVGTVLQVTVPAQHRKPYTFRGRFFRRDGSTSPWMSRAEIEELFQAAGRLHFDRAPSSGADGGAGPEIGPESKPEVRPKRRPETEQESGSPYTSSRGSLDMRVLAQLVDGPLSKSAIARRLGHRSVSGGLNRVIRRLRSDGHVEYTLPEKPNSSRQQYRLTESGGGVLAGSAP